MILFYPTSTISERLEVIKKCKRDKSPPKELQEAFPDLASLIMRMIAVDPKTRPSVREVIDNPIFLETQGASSSSLLPTSLESPRSISVSTKIGDNGTWKTRYIKVGKEGLLAYKNKTDAKAKFCYFFSECKLNLAPESDCASTLEFPKEEAKAYAVIKRRQSMDPMWLYKVSRKFIFRIEHPELETLSLKIENKEQMRLLEVIKLGNEVQIMLT